ncbi:glycosyltransferase [Acetobacter oeni]|nr:glycosyltransferase [Acetobacter oeni]
MTPETGQPASPRTRSGPAPPPGLITGEDRANWKRQADEQAQEAFRQGQQSWSAGDHAAALRWLERAHRMAPESPNVAFFLAGVRQANGFRDEAITLLQNLSRRYDFRQGWTLLAAALLNAGRTGEALQALSEVLSRHVCDDALVRLADRIVAAAGAPGWCGIDRRGAVRPGGRFLRDLPARTGRRGKDAAGRGRRPAAGMPEGLSLEVDGVACETGNLADDLLWPSEVGRRWSGADTVAVCFEDVPLVGSPLRPGVATRTEGIVQAGPDGLTGWVWHPNDPGQAPLIRIFSEGQGESEGQSETVLSLTAEAFSTDVSSDIPVARYRAIAVPWSDLPDGMIHVRSEAGKDLTGSPLDPGLERRAARWAARQACSVSMQGEPPREPPPPFMPVPVTTAPCDAPVVSGHFAAGTRPGIMVIVPVYRDVQRTRACLNSLLTTLRTAESAVPEARVFVIDDASPEPGMTRMLEEIAGETCVTVVRNTRNLGFSASVNVGLRAALPVRTGRRRGKNSDGYDVVLLNSDTLVADGWLEELQAVAWSDAAIGTVTPLSNDATIMSYPDLTRNTVPTLARTQRMMRLARMANGGTAIDVPTAHGFCMYIRQDCLKQTGLLRADLFAQGYGEENDFSLRARCLGWRNVAAPGAYVAHVGSVSFGATRNALLTRNLALLNRLHPGYDALIGAHVAADPLFEVRRRLDLLRWRRSWPAGPASESGAPVRKNADRKRTSTKRSVILVTHDYGGGVERVVRARARRLREDGIQPVIVRPVEGGCRIDGWRADSAGETDRLNAKLPDSADGLYPGLRFRLPEEWPALLRVLTAGRVLHIEWHHASGHHMAMRELAAAIGVPYDVYVHDYIWFCPRISLLGVAGRYCGEPDLAGCEQCLAVLGRNVRDDLPLADYILRSAEELKSARAVVTPSEDAARRMRRHFPDVRFSVEPPEDDRPDLDLAEFSDVAASGKTSGPGAVTSPRTDRFRICVIGAIGKEKGYDVLLAAARDAREKTLPLEYIIAGHTPDDLALMETGHVYVTGAYKEDEAISLIRAQQADYGFIPSVWPETWCLALGVAWRAGLRVAAFDIGAVADRIRATERGTILPPGISAARLNVILTSLCQGSVSAPVR